MFINFVHFSKNQLLVSFFLSIVFLVYFIYLHSDLYYFISYNFGFLGGYSSSFSCKVRLFESFLVSWHRLTSFYTFHLELLLVCSIHFETVCFYFHLSQSIFNLLFGYFVNPFLFNNMLLIHVCLFFPCTYLILTLS